MGKTTISVTLPAKLENLRAFLDAARKFAEENQMRQDQLEEFILGVEEVLVNIMNYAYEERVKDIEMTAACTDQGVMTVCFTDLGKEFDPTLAVDPDLDREIDERGGGGLGIYLVKQLMDDLVYERRGGRNITTMVKKVAR